MSDEDATAAAMRAADAVLAELGQSRDHLVEAEQEVVAWLLGEGGLAQAEEDECRLARALDRRRRRARAKLREQIEEAKRESVRRRLADGR